MKRDPKARKKLLDSLQERAKELNCLYRVEEILSRSDETLDQVFQAIVEVMAPGWQYPDLCQAKITFDDRIYISSPFDPTPWVLSAGIFVQDRKVGDLRVYYLEERPDGDQGPFLNEEVRLINTIAQRLGHYILYQQIKNAHQSWQDMQVGYGSKQERSWKAPVKLLRESDRALYLRLARKMLNHLVRIGVSDARKYLPAEETRDADLSYGEVNVPGRKFSSDEAHLLSDSPFELAGNHINDDEILGLLQKWVYEDKAGAFIRILSSPRSSLLEIADALRRFHLGLGDGSELAPSTLKSLRVTLTQKLLTEQIDFVRTAKKYVETKDFEALLDKMIIPGDSHGKLGGKSSGLFLAQKILQRAPHDDRPIGKLKVPRTWYLVSDGLLAFIHHNDLQDVIEQKYKEIDQVRQEYPNIVQLFKGSSFPSRIIDGLSVALDDLGKVPLIVRSSSLLEDRMGTAFSGKYKSLFIPNQGPKRKRLEALMDAVAEVYASTFGPDPIEYRAERGLLEFNEEMGIVIQAVVGQKVGKYFFPAFAGVAFSNNEFRWSTRIKREDGLIRIVPGLGTRAVDRVGDDYPVLIVPGQPNLRVNVAIDEVIRYSPQKADVINLEANTLDTVEISELMKEIGSEYPSLELVFSVHKEGMLNKPVGLLVDPQKDDLVATFGGLLTNSKFVRNLGNIMSILQEQLGTPVDIEFAHDGKDLYLLQCRPQSYSPDETPAPIPKDVAEKDTLFSANKYISNGWIPDITHIVYVDPNRYGELSSRNDMLAVGRAVGRLNRLLPKRQFILMGPGRWGSRGDIKLGVSVTYADISNTAMLIEIAKKRGEYLPDLSFGTHFFQDLVESRIRYLPLYPDDENIMFNEKFLLSASNLVPQMIPEFTELADTLRVIDVPAESDGRILRVLMNAELDEAIGVFMDRSEESTQPLGSDAKIQKKPGHYWRWRLKMAEKIAAELDAERFGVQAIYVFGSTKNATAGPGSDIDLLVHFRGTEKQNDDLMNWFEGWSLCLSEMNYLRTGYVTEGLLDVHLVTDKDIENRTSYAVKIGAVTDAAREMPLSKK